MKVNDIVHKNISITKTQPINIDISPTEIIGIIGKNGSGKSSLINIIINKILPEQGYITTRCSFSFLSSNFLLKNHTKLSYQLNFFTKNYKNFPWPNFLNQKFEDLSAGEKRLVSLWIHLQNPVNLYIIDEPFLFLDENNKQHIQLLMNEKLEEKKSIVIAHQHVNDLSSLKNIKIVSL